MSGEDKKAEILDICFRVHNEFKYSSQHNSIMQFLLPSIDGILFDNAGRNVRILMEQVVKPQINALGLAHLKRQEKKTGGKGKSGGEGGEGGDIDLGGDDLALTGLLPHSALHAVNDFIFDGEIMSSGGGGENAGGFQGEGSQGTKFHTAVYNSACRIYAIMLSYLQLQNFSGFDKGVVQVLELPKLAQHQFINWLSMQLE